MTMIGIISKWLSYAGGAFIKVADPAGSTVCRSCWWVDSGPRLYAIWDIGRFIISFC